MFRDSSLNANSQHKHKKGAGLHENYRNRVAETIIDKMIDKHYYWLDKDERKEISHKIFQKCSFPNCLGLMHRTSFSLFLNLTEIILEIIMGESFSTL